MKLTELERTALDWFAGFYCDDLPLLARHLKSATPISRENTGNGFFTGLAVSPASTPQLIDCPSPLDGLRVRFEGMTEGLELLLFFKDGYAHQLEGYAIAGEVTSSIDLETAPFVASDMWPKKKVTND